MANRHTHNGTGYPLGTSQTPYRRGASAVTAFTGALRGAGYYAHALTPPTQDLTNGVFVLGPLDPLSNLLLSFHGTHGTDANDKVGTGRLWLVTELVDEGLQGRPVEYVGHLVYDFTLTVGNSAVGASSVIIPAAAGVSHKWVDTIAPASGGDKTRGGAVISGDFADGVAELMLDSVGRTHAVVQLSAGEVASSATGLGVVWRQV
jgi:hypothetical protein